MTRRQRLDQNKRAMMIVALIGIALITATLLWLPRDPIWFPIAQLLTCAIFLGALLYGWLIGLRCPSCRGSWYALAMTGLSKGLLKLDKRIHYCPYCGCDIDANCSS